ncbi:MAG: Na+/H+ antiporter NhaC family protein, partial [Halanaerobiales bacterium]
MEDTQEGITFQQSLLPIITMVFFILMSVLVWEVPIHLALFFELAVTIFLALYWGYSWSTVEEMLFSSFKDIGNVLLILFLIGMIIAIWIAGGTVPSLIYYGLKVINPRFFLVISFVLTSLVSMAMGTGFGTVSTVGLALISIAGGLGVSLPVAAGAIISGAYVGDRMSPISSIAILTAHTADIDINSMVSHMIYTIIPPYTLAFIFYLIIGMRGGAGSEMGGELEILLAGLRQYHLISGWLVLLPLIIIVMAIFRFPTIINLLINLFLSLFLALLTTGRTWRELLNIIYRGYNSSTGIKLIDNLLSRGGFTSMMELNSLIILAVLLGGLFAKLGILDNILSRLIKLIKNQGQLIMITMISSIITAVLGCNQLL